MKLLTRIGAMAAAALLLMMTAGGAAAEKRPEMQLHQIHLPGDANAHVLIAGDTVIFVDCGTDTDVHATPEPMFDYMRALGIDHVDAHFVTHFHNDHSQQIDDLSEMYGTDDTILYIPTEELPERFLPLPKGKTRQLKCGEETDVGPFHVKCVGPEQVTHFGNSNVDSLNFIVSYGDTDILFTGDFCSKRVGAMFPEDLRKVDVLVFPHHGLTPHPITWATLVNLFPKVVLVPGKNAGSVRTIFAAYRQSPEVYSFHDGNVVLLSDGEEITAVTDADPAQFPYGKN